MPDYAADSSMNSEPDPSKLGAVLHHGSDHRSGAVLPVTKIFRIPNEFDTENIVEKCFEGDQITLFTVVVKLLPPSRNNRVPTIVRRIFLRDVQ